jgi:flagellar basal-body rod protein FlgB
VTTTISPLFGDSTLQSLKLTIDASGLRHQAIASNVANVSTPQYKRVDLSSEFQTEFKNALSRLDRGESVKPSFNPSPIQKDPNSFQEKADGNNVNIDSEMLEMIKNQSLFEFSSTLAARRYSSMKAAITGRTS